MKGYKALYITYDGLTEPLGQSQILPYMKGLTAQGLEVTILSCEKANRLTTGKETVMKICKDSGIHWEYLTYHKTPPVLSTVLDVRNLISKARKLYKKEHYNIVHCRSYIAALAGLDLKKKYGVKFIFDMRGFWADERVDGKLWNLSNPLFNWIYKYFKRKEKTFLNQADYIISLTENAKNEMTKWPVNQPLPVEVIPTCADLNLFDYHKTDIVEKENLKSNMALDNRFPVLGYIGAIGTWYMLTEMLRFFKRLLIQYPGAVFLIVSKEGEGYILAEALKAGVPEESIRITTSTFKEVPKYISLFDFSIFFIKPLYSKKASVPTKLGELMGMGVPVIFNGGVGDLEIIMDSSEYGMQVNSFEDSDFDKIINNIDALINANPITIRAKAEKSFSLQSGIEGYRKVYNHLLNNLRKV